MLNTTIITLDVKDHIRTSATADNYSVHVYGEGSYNGLTLAFAEDGLPILDSLIAELEKVRVRLAQLHDAEQARNLVPMRRGDVPRSSVESSPTYRSDMRDAGRGGLLRG